MKFSEYNNQVFDYLEYLGIEDYVSFMPLRPEIIGKELARQSLICWQKQFTSRMGALCIFGAFVTAVKRLHIESKETLN